MDIVRIKVTCLSCVRVLCVSGEEDSRRHHADPSGHAHSGGLWCVRGLPAQPIHRVGQIGFLWLLHEQGKHHKETSQSARDWGLLLHCEFTNEGTKAPQHGAQYTITRNNPVVYFFYVFHLQKYKEYLNGSNLIVKLQAKHDLLKQTLGEGILYISTLVEWKVVVIVGGLPNVGSVLSGTNNRKNIHQY